MPDMHETLDIKEKLVASFGDKCAICNQKYPVEVYEFYNTETHTHHRKSLKDRLVDINNCVMVCANCKKMLRHGTAVVPADANRVDGTMIPAIDDSPNYCKVCGTLIRSGKGTVCSPECANRLSKAIDKEKSDILGILARLNKK